MNYALSWYLGLSHGLREDRSNRRTVRRSLWRAARAALRGTLHSRGSSATADLPRADRLFSIENPPAPLSRPPAHGLLLFLRPPAFLLTHPARLLSFPPSAYLASVSRFVEPSAPCHPIDDDSMLSLTESRESESPVRSGGCCETATADHTGRPRESAVESVHETNENTAMGREMQQMKENKWDPFLVESPGIQGGLSILRVCTSLFCDQSASSFSLGEQIFILHNITLDDESMSKRIWKCTWESVRTDADEIQHSRVRQSRSANGRFRRIPPCDQSDAAFS